jgi:hypothetical protein
MDDKPVTRNPTDDVSEQPQSSGNDGKTKGKAAPTTPGTWDTDAAAWDAAVWGD